MALELYDPKEILEAEIDGAIFKYKRSDYGTQVKISCKHISSKGKIDMAGLTLDTLKACIIGWENVNRDGKPVEFKPELIEALPPSIGNQLYSLIDIASRVKNEEVEEAVKNS